MWRWKAPRRPPSNIRGSNRNIDRPFAIIGFFRKTLEISGAKNGVAEFSTPIADGKGYAVLSLTLS
jgi:hypothetical protein